MNYCWVFYYFQIKIILIWIIRQHLASLYLFVILAILHFLQMDSAAARLLLVWNKNLQPCCATFQMDWIQLG